MRVAIIERNTRTQSQIKKSLSKHRNSGKDKRSLWEIDYYIDPEKFLKEKSFGYDVVLVDCDMGDKVCFDFIHKVSNKTDAELCIMTDTSCAGTLENLLNDEAINHILSRDNLNNVLELLEYSSARLNIKNHMNNESGVYETIADKMF